MAFKKKIKVQKASQICQLKQTVLHLTKRSNFFKLSASVHRLHAEEQLQRVGSSHALLGHGCPHLLQLVLFRREGGAGDGLLKHSGLILVSVSSYY